MDTRDQVRRDKEHEHLEEEDRDPGEDERAWPDEGQHGGTDDGVEQSHHHDEHT